MPEGDSLRVSFERDPFHTKVIQTRGKPFLKLPTVDEEPGRPDGPVLVLLPDGREWVFSNHTTHVPVYDLTTAAESGVRADHARAGGCRGLDDRWRIPITRRFSGRLST